MFLPVGTEVVTLVASNTEINQQWIIYWKITWKTTSHSPGECIDHKKEEKVLSFRVLTNN